MSDTAAHRQADRLPGPDDPAPDPAAAPDARVQRTLTEAHLLLRGYTPASIEQALRLVRQGDTAHDALALLRR